MTWHMQTGDRVLDAAESALVLEAVDEMRNYLQLEHQGAEQWGYEVRVFDELTLGQRLLLLCDVLDALLRPTAFMPQLTSVSEGAVAAIFACVTQCFDFAFENNDVPPPEEDESGFYYRWQKLILACLGPEADEEEPLTITSDDQDRWHTAIEAISDRILWDADYDLDDVTTDSDPKTAKRIKCSLSIDAGYFRAVVPEPRDDEIDGLLERLKMLGS